MSFSEAYAQYLWNGENSAPCAALRWEVTFANVGSLLGTWFVSNSHTSALAIGSAFLQTLSPASLPSGASQAGACPRAFAPVISLPAVFSPRSWHGGPFSNHLA